MLYKSKVQIKDSFTDLSTTIIENLLIYFLLHYLRIMALVDYFLKVQDELPHLNKDI